MRFKFLGFWGFVFFVFSFSFVGAYDFVDFDDNHTYREAVLWGKNKGYVSGFQKNNAWYFEPDKEINRAEFTTIMVDALYEVGDGRDCFDDLKNSDQWYEKYICTAKEKGIINGYPDGLFHPERSINFAEASVIILNSTGYKFDDVNPYYKNHVQFLSDQKSIPVSISSLESKITKAEMMEIFWRVKIMKKDKESMVFSNGEIVDVIAGVENENNVQEQVDIEDIRDAFSRKNPDLDYQDAVITINSNFENKYVDGGVGSLDNMIHYWATKVENEWIIVQVAQDFVPCSVFEPYNFPLKMIKNYCYMLVDGIWKTYTSEDFGISFEYFIDIKALKTDHPQFINSVFVTFVPKKNSI